MRKHLRRQLKRVRREADRHGLPGDRIAASMANAFRNVATGCGEILTESEVAGKNQILAYVKAHSLKIVSSPHYRALRDPVVYCYWPDEADAQLMSQLTPLARVNGAPVTDAFLRGMSQSETFVVLIRERSEVITLHQIDRHIWSAQNWAMMQHAPPGAVTVIYDGTACGHGVAHILFMNSIGVGLS
jgi:hypothetical protein